MTFCIQLYSKVFTVNDLVGQCMSNIARAKVHDGLAKDPDPPSPFSYPPMLAYELQWRPYFSAKIGIFNGINIFGMVLIFFVFVADLNQYSL